MWQRVGWGVDLVLEHWRIWVRRMKMYILKVAETGKGSHSITALYFERVPTEDFG
jgi:hypothetical protein